MHCPSPIRLCYHCQQYVQECEDWEILKVYCSDELDVVGAHIPAVEQSAQLNTHRQWLPCFNENYRSNLMNEVECSVKNFKLKLPSLLNM